jgi:hypothetical protein
MVFDPLQCVVQRLLSLVLILQYGFGTVIARARRFRCQALGCVGDVLFDVLISVFVLLGESACHAICKVMLGVLFDMDIEISRRDA